jgi:hypothetical protein
LPLYRVSKVFAELARLPSGKEKRLLPLRHRGVIEKFSALGFRQIESKYGRLA